MIGCTYYPAQGATYFFEMAQALARLGMDVQCVALARPGEALQETAEGVRVMRIALRPGWAISPLWRMRFFVAAMRRVRAHGPDIVHVYSSLGAFVLPLLMRSGRAKWVHEMQSGAVVSGFRLGRWLENTARRFQCRFFDVNLTVTEGLRGKLFGRRPLPNVHVLPAGVNVRRFQRGDGGRIRQALGLHPTDVAFLYAGALHPARELGILVEAFARVMAETSQTWLLLVGDGPDRRRLISLAERLGVHSRVIIPGYVLYLDLPDYFAAAQVGLSHVPVHRGFGDQPPMKVMEFMASGLPTVGTDNESHRTLIRHGVTGLLVEPAPDAFARGMLALAQSEELRRRLGEYARRAAEDYDWTVIARDRLLPIYRSILHSSARERAALPGGL